MVLRCEFGPFYKVDFGGWLTRGRLDHELLPMLREAPFFATCWYSFSAIRRGGQSFQDEGLRTHPRTETDLFVVGAVGGAGTLHRMVVDHSLQPLNQSTGLPVGNGLTSTSQLVPGAGPSQEREVRFSVV